LDPYSRYDVSQMRNDAAINPAKSENICSGDMDGVL
jgi:hypothetical protein